MLGESPRKEFATGLWMVQLALSFDVQLRGSLCDSKERLMGVHEGSYKPYLLHQEKQDTDGGIAAAVARVGWFESMEERVYASSS